MKLVGLIFLLTLSFFSWGQTYPYGESISFRKQKEKNPSQIVDYGVKGDLNRLKSNSSIHYKYSNADWHFIRCTSVELSSLIQNGIITQVYFSPGKPSVLCDTMRIVQNIDSIHNGNYPLNSSFTGKGVIIGYVDTGIDYNHLDFQNSDGSTRILYYWDQTLPFDAQLTPPKYNYGQVWDSTHINSGTITSIDNNAHGTTVSGAGSGNGLATGTHKGAAPESDIIIIETNFSSPNWTMTVADAIDFVFSMADTLGKPAIVNTSVGDYLGSHDGLDPAAQYIDSLLNDQTGRIVVAAAGNSGAQGKYHLHGDVNADTSFTWFDVNMSSTFGTPSVYFDLWADTADFKDVYFAFGADNPNPTYDFRGRTGFYNIQSLINTTTLDSIYVNGNKLAPVEFYCEEVNGVYHIEALLENIDSTSYSYRFETYGSGAYDLWSGAWIGLNNIKSTNLPLVGDFPDIAYYHLPDTLMTTVSSWTCSPSVVTVGNFTNRKQYLDYNSNWYYGAYPPGMLSVNSSKGPNRQGVTKPDVAASGDLILASCPLWLSASLQSSNPAMLDVDGQHVRNGGTSMASPVIAGIAALYLEKCPASTYQEFIDDIHLNAYEDSWTGTTPNQAYGYGKVNAFQLLNQTNSPLTLLGDTLICETPITFETAENNFASYDWHNGDTNPSLTIDWDDTVHVTTTNSQGCTFYSDTIIVVKGTLPTFPVINQIGGGLITSPADSIQWYYEGTPIDSANAQFYNPDTTGEYSVEVFGAEGCSYLSSPYFIDLSQIHELESNEFIVLPNPFDDHFSIIKNEYFDIHFIVTDIRGRMVYEYDEIDSNQQFIEVDMSTEKSGVYILHLQYGDNFTTFRLVKK
ncbi:S8 family peptidase [Paracrocinitomix mangrovi]|uniref:S8 family peptidase n=1 Tax=Paracrocinitomix mangrovi TaxID=2862509 RepID=UPI001C8F1B00|nr:S8 family peptidase [Paracrocinitomix mangrovi]UKN02584.1 S8 family peptidase [Paracrocinitomix mangrovi]